jgi:hypothetical protein
MTGKVMGRKPNHRVSSEQSQNSDPKTISLPVTCPHCGASSMSEFPLPVVLIALTRWNNMALYAECHATSWSASPDELERLREYLGPDWLSKHGVVPAPMPFFKREPEMLP